MTLTTLGLWRSAVVVQVLGYLVTLPIPSDVGGWLYLGVSLGNIYIVSYVQSRSSEEHLFYVAAKSASLLFVGTFLTLLLFLFTGTDAPDVRFTGFLGYLLASVLAYPVLFLLAFLVGILQRRTRGNRST